MDDLDELEAPEVEAIGKRAIELIDGGWIQGGMATDHLNLPISCLSEAACNFCLTGAIHRATYEALEAHAFWEAGEWNSPHDPVAEELTMLLQSVLGVSPVHYNDSIATSKEPIKEAITAMVAEFARRKVEAG